MHSLFGCEELDIARFNLRSRFLVLPLCEPHFDNATNLPKRFYRKLLTFLIGLRCSDAHTASLFIF